MRKIVAATLMAVLMVATPAEAASHSWSFTGRGHCNSSGTVSIYWQLGNSSPSSYIIIKSSGIVPPVGWVVPPHGIGGFDQNGVHYSKSLKKYSKTVVGQWPSGNKFTATAKLKMVATGGHTNPWYLCEHAEK